MLPTSPDMMVPKAQQKADSLRQELGQQEVALGQARPNWCLGRWPKENRQVLQGVEEAELERESLIKELELLDSNGKKKDVCERLVLFF